MLSIRYPIPILSLLSGSGSGSDRRSMIAILPITAYTPYTMRGTNRYVEGHTRMIDLYFCYCACPLQTFVSVVVVHRAERAVAVRYSRSGVECQQDLEVRVAALRIGWRDYWLEHDTYKQSPDYFSAR